MRPPIARTVVLGAFLAGCSDGVDLLGKDSDDTSGGGGGGEGTTICPMDVDLGVSTTSGCVLGAENTIGASWRGIPYAKAPVGDLRFAPPERAEPPADPIDASDYGPVCPQERGADQSIEDAEQDEDCLSVNVWAPSGAEDLPVVVHLHGGGHRAGSGRLTYADYPHLSEEAVVVTLNYRLGALGFLAHPELTAESGHSGNMGIQDAILGLEWVQDNIKGFGGSPDDVLLWGFSAGAGSTCTIIESPLGAGLFSQAFIESGFCAFEEPPVHSDYSMEHTGESLGLEFAAAVGCSDLDCLRATDPDVIVGAQDSLPNGNFGILYDGHVLPEPGRNLLRSGTFNKVPIYVGNVSDEMWGTFDADEIATDDDLIAALTDEASRWGIDRPDALIPEYTSEKYGSAAEAYSQFLSDANWVCPGQRFLSDTAPWTDTYSWWFSHTSELSVTGGNSHGSDLVYFFHDGLYEGDGEDELSVTMMNSIKSVLRHEPMIDGLGDWPAYDPDGDRETVNFDLELSTIRSPRGDLCDWLFGLGLNY